MGLKIGLLIGCIILAPTGNMLLKHGMMQAGGLNLRTFLEPYILAGIVLYIGSFLMWLKLLQIMDISVVYPVFVAAAFIIVTIAAILIFGEKVNATRLVGIGVVVAGIAIVSISGR